MAIGPTIRNWLNDPERRKRRLEAKDAKNQLKQSEAALNNAIAQAALSGANQRSGGGNAGAIIGITFGVLTLAGIVGFVAYKSSKK